jgi:dynein heavy chain
LCNFFLGLAQTGAWGCWDDFHRINIEVLSVVAQQILCILSALAERAKSFVFEGQEINLVLSCGIFITVNPGRKIAHVCIYKKIGSYICKMS